MRRKIFPIYLSDEEKAIIKDKADKANLSIAEYMRRTSLNYDVTKRKPRNQIKEDLLYKTMEKNLKGKVKFLDNDTIELEPW